MRTKKPFFKTLFVGVAFFAASSATAATLCEMTTDAGADQTINICDIAADRVTQPDNTTADGTVFFAKENPSSPSTGTGVFEPFLRTQRSSGGDAGGLELGFSTDTGEPAINFNTKNGSDWTRAIQVGDLSAFSTLEFALDANQEGPVGSADNLILLTDVQIYIGSEGLGTSFATPEDYMSGDPIADTGYTGTPFDSSDNSLLGEAPKWSLDNETNGDVTVVLEAAICGAPGSVHGQCGSGHGDMVMSIPLLAIDLEGVSPDDYLVFYTEFALGNDGFEEWKRAPGQPIPEPTAALLFGVGALIVSKRRGGRRR